MTPLWMKTRDPKINNTMNLISVINVNISVQIIWVIFWTTLLSQICWLYDCLLLLNKKHIRNILQIVNSFHSLIKFTSEIPNDNRSNFQDITVTVIDNKIFTNLYKDTATGRCMNFFSYLTQKYIKAVILGLVGRAIVLSDDPFHTKISR